MSDVPPATVCVQTGRVLSGPKSCRNMAKPVGAGAPARCAAKPRGDRDGPGELDYEEG